MLLNKNSVLVCVTLILCISCSVKKRKYQKGYFVEWKNLHSGSAQSKKCAPVNLIGDEKRHESLTTFKGIESYATKAVYKPNSFCQQECILLKGGDSCDVVRLKDSSQLNCKVLEVSESIIRYRQCDSKKNKVKRISKAKISYINYFNGTSEQIVYVKPVKKKKKNLKMEPLALFSSILGPWGFGTMLLTIVAVLFEFTPLALLIPIVLSLCAIANGLASLKKLRNHPGEYRGKRQAIIGIIFGSLALMALFVFLLFTF